MTGGERYRPEIDGLRAVAIAAVALYHAGLPGLRNGYAGVDIFFVISGFLITRMLVAELTGTGRIDFVAFYARRVRRLLPALLFVVAVVLALGAFVLSAAGERQELSWQAIATLAFVSNIYFWRSQATYFAGPAEWLPLLNMWTLSVEEQFYFFWPALLAGAVFAARTMRRGLPAVLGAMLVVLFVASCAVFVWGAAARPTAAFYLMPARLWEFALGGAVALAEPSLARWARFGGVLAWAGLAAIALAVVVLRRGFPMSAVIAAAAFGAAAVIAGVSARPASAPGRLLALPPFVAIGKLSYSWYLWHWPLLALARLHDFGERSHSRDLLVVLGALVFAALTYVLIENPIRRRKPWPFSGAWQTAAAAAVLSATIALLATALDLQADAAARRDTWLGAIYAAKRGAIQPPPSCVFARAFSALPPAQTCLIGAAQAPPRLLLWGDSHAQHFIETIRDDATRGNYAAFVWSMSACPPLLDMRDVKPRPRIACVNFNDAVAKELSALSKSGLEGVVLASRHYNFPLGVSVSDERRAAWAGSLRRVLATARASHVRVLVIAPVPTWSFPVPECLSHLPVERCGASRAAIDTMRGPLVAALSEVIAEFDNARLWNPVDSFCDQRICSPVRDGKILYWDWSHLSAVGSRSLVAAAAPHLDWLLQ